MDPTDASRQELHQALRGVLSNKDIAKVKAQLRHTLLAAMDPNPSLYPQPPPHAAGKEVMVMNALVCDYLRWLGCQFTLDTFTQEIGGDKEMTAMDRGMVAEALGLDMSTLSSQLPLLAALLPANQNNTEN